VLDWGREIGRDPEVGDAREWLCANGIGGFALGTVSGILTRRYHGLLVAALTPPLGRTLLVARAEERLLDGPAVWELAANRWADGTIAPRGFELIERFRLEGTMPVWTYACADLRVEKRVWMEHGANTTYVGYRLARGRRSVTLELRALVDYRDYHTVTRGGDWWMAVAPVPHGIRVEAYDGARPFFLFADHADIQPAHDWYRGFRLAREEERGLESVDDHLHAATFVTTLAPGADFTLVLSTEETADLDGTAALRRHGARERRLLADWRRGSPIARQAPAYVRQLVLAGDLFVAGDLAPAATAGPEPNGGGSERNAREAVILAGYPWFADWGRDAMIALAGLTLATGRPGLARRLLIRYGRFVDGGMLPNRFGEMAEAPAYNSVDAALWYIEATRAYDAATKDDDTLALLFPVLESIVTAYRAGTRYGIQEDPSDHLIRAGEPGAQLTWMDAKIDDHVVTPRAGKPVEINALWYNALCAMRGLAARLGRPTAEWDALAAVTRAGFARFWNAETDCCFDVIDTPDGSADAAIRPNQVLAVSLPASALSPGQQRAVVEVCERRLLTSYGLRTLTPDDPRYRGRYAGDVRARDTAYHEGTAWGWLLGPFALAHFRVHGDREAALALLQPIGHHLADAGLGGISEVFDGDALAKLGCGGLLGVNAGSVEPPRMVKLTYRPANAGGEPAKATGHLVMAGKGITYDSGGINLKPGDAMHGVMKMDMAGAAAVLAAMSALAALGCPTAVTGYLMCTDNMPSGSAQKMGDVLTIRGGKTIEVLNTDAEGRLILADALALAVEDHPDAIVNIATLTGACLRALGDQIAGVLGNHQGFIDQVAAAARSTDESVWQLPLDKRYRKQLDSPIADMKNMGADSPGAITAALFLAEFVGDVPWAHLDICGPMCADADESWRPKGATGFGARLLIDLALNFTRPAARA